LNPVTVVGGEAVDPLGGSGDADTAARLGMRVFRAVGPVGFAGAGWARTTTLMVGGDQVRDAWISDLVAFEGALVVEPKSSKVFRDGKRAARMRPSPPWASRAAAEPYGPATCLTSRRRTHLSRDDGTGCKVWQSDRTTVRSFRAAPTATSTTAGASRRG
jgi:hypothetical protein